MLTVLTCYTNTTPEQQRALPYIAESFIASPNAELRPTA